MIKTGEPAGVRPKPPAGVSTGEAHGTCRPRLEARLRALQADLLSEGTRLPQPLRASLLDLVDGVGGLLAAHEALEREVAQLRRELRRTHGEARRDPLSGLPNRLHFEEVAAREFTHARRDGLPLHLSVLDLDHFKRCNDTYGHVVGDMVLQRTGLVLQRVIRDRVFAARMGGEEFAVLLPGLDTRPVLELIESVREALAREEIVIRRYGHRIVLRATLSGGVARLAASDGTMTELYARADQALYRAKRLGRNRLQLG